MEKYIFVLYYLYLVKYQDWGYESNPKIPFQNWKWWVPYLHRKGCVEIFPQRSEVSKNIFKKKGNISQWKWQINSFLLLNFIYRSAHAVETKSTGHFVSIREISLGDLKVVHAKLVSSMLFTTLQIMNWLEPRLSSRMQLWRSMPHHSDNGTSPITRYLLDVNVEQNS